MDVKIGLERVMAVDLWWVRFTKVEEGDEEAILPECPR